MLIQTEGIVIKQNPYKEKDAMISVLTKDGMVSFLARSVLSLTSKNKSACLPFSLAEFSLSSKGDKLTLTQAKLVKSYSKFYESLDLLSSINLISECICKFVDEENTSLYPYLKNYLELLDKGFDEATLTTIMLAQIIKYSGYSLEYNECVECGSKNNIVGVSFSLGGFICSKCVNESFIKKSQTYLKSFRYSFMLPADMMDHYVLDIKVCYQLINDFCNHLCNSFGIHEIKALEIYNTSKNPF
jgi:DNA repair protein RecO (recombination protein O)